MKARQVRVKGPRGVLSRDFKHLAVDMYLVEEDGQKKLKVGGACFRGGWMGAAGEERVGVGGSAARPADRQCEVGMWGGVGFRGGYRLDFAGSWSSLGNLQGTPGAGWRARGGGGGPGG